MTRGSNRTFTGVMRAVGILFVLCSIVLSAQNRPRPDRDYDPNGQESDRHDVGTSAGGKWTEYRAEDPMTAAKKVRFELPAANSGDRDEQGRIILYCTDGKLKLADFRPNVRLSRPDWPGFW